MSRKRARRDRRYTVTLEYCGHARRQHIASFCGQWLGHAATQPAALAIAHQHAAARIACLDAALDDARKTLVKEPSL